MAMIANKPMQPHAGRAGGMLSWRQGGMGVTIDVKGLRELYADLAAQGVNLQQALTLAVNKTVRSARTRVTRLIASELALKTSDVRDKNLRMRLANYRSIEASIRVSGRRIPLIRFAARQGKKGVSYRIRRSGGRSTLAGAFIARMPSGHQGVFIRTGSPQMSRTPAAGTSKRLGRRKGMGFLTRPRLPITERFGPSVPMALDKSPEMTSGELLRTLRNELAGNVEVQVRLALQRRQARAAAAAGGGA